MRPRFLPLTVKSRLPAWAPLIGLYLDSPFKPLGKQMLVRARPKRPMTAQTRIVAPSARTAQHRGAGCGWAAAGSAPVSRVTFASAGLAAIRYPWELDYGEGIVWQQMRWIFTDKAYGPIDQFPAIVFHYPPLYHAVTAISAGALGTDELATGRAISLLSTMAAAVASAMLVGLLLKGRANRGGSPPRRLRRGVARLRLHPGHQLGAVDARRHAGDRAQPVWARRGVQIAGAAAAHLSRVIAVRRRGLHQANNHRRADGDLRGAGCGAAQARSAGDRHLPGAGDCGPAGARLADGRRLLPAHFPLQRQSAGLQPLVG